MVRDARVVLVGVSDVIYRTGRRWIGGDQILCGRQESGGDSVEVKKAPFRNPESYDWHMDLAGTHLRMTADLVTSFDLHALSMEKIEN